MFKMVISSIFMHNGNQENLCVHLDWCTEADLMVFKSKEAGHLGGSVS